MSFVDRREYKCELYGSSLIIVDRWFPSSKTCSRCGTVKESLLLSERVFNCENCNFSCDCSATLARTRFVCVAFRRKCSIKFSYGGQFAPQR
ncbi:transposase [Okeania sp. SIO2B3]|uniref:transposase n=1 Tax=Okeania sp. SIO2B3 TaxID=2607784 RepID=UPI0025D8A526|nr:transposase [Okeania sp. SIO2B3]